jgi:hypothetical protein
MFFSIFVLAILLAAVGGAFAQNGINLSSALDSPVGAGFMFQGQLKDAGGAVTGSCDMIFKLYDDMLAGVQIGSDFAATVPVNNGQFTVLLNSSGEFGATAFDGNARWLEVAVKCPGDADFTTLSPRQQITAAPYAQYALGGHSAVTSTWIQQTPRNVAPDPRDGTANAYDAANDRFILFGGSTTGGAPFPTDVWVLEKASGLGGTSGWIQLSPVGGPPPGRQLGTAVYDPTSNSLIVHGGCAGGCAPALSDTWVLSNANGLGGTPGWTQLPNAPVARDYHTAVYDPGSNRMIVFGGNQAFPGTDLNDVWVLIDANGIGTPSWTQLSPIGTPPAVRNGSNAVYDPATNRMIVFGGVQISGSPYTYYNDVWILTNANGLGGSPEWIQLNPMSDLPAARALSSTVFDPISNRMTLFGGGIYDEPTNVYFDDVWVLTEANGVGKTPQWTQIVPHGGLPTVRANHAAGYSLSSNRMIVTTGTISGTGWTNEVWLFTNANGLVR